MKLMKSTPSKNGFSLIIVVIALLIIITGLGIVILLPNANDDGDLSSDSTEQSEEDKEQADFNTPPTIYNLGVELNIFDPDTGYAGEVLFVRDLMWSDRVFEEYGMSYEGMTGFSA